MGIGKLSFCAQYVTICPTSSNPCLASLLAGALIWTFWRIRAPIGHVEFAESFFHMYSRSCSCVVVLSQ